MITVQDPAMEQHVVLHGVPWKTYLALRELPESEHIRMTYDQGELEMMSPSRRHEQYAALIDHLVTTWAIELRIDVANCRTMTFKRKDLKRGLEPDNCYYIQHERVMRAKAEVDFKVDPPPDLAIEVDVTRKTLDKMPMYAAFGVPEVWRFDGRKPQVYLLGAGQHYHPTEAPVCLPGFPLREAERLLEQLGTESETALVRAFQDWVRANVTPPSPPSPPGEPPGSDRG